MLIKIPVTSEVYFFILQELGQEPVMVNAQNKHLIADKLYDLLSRPTVYREYQTERLAYTHTLRFEVCEHLTRLNAIDLSEEKVYRFNHFVRQLLQQRLFHLLDAVTAVKKVKVTTIICEYMQTYQLQDTSINYEMLKKAYYRYRQSQQVRLVPSIAACVA